jgi:Putative transposase.
LAYDGKVLSAVGRIFVDSVLGFYWRRMRTEGVTGGQSGAVTVVQRCNSDLKLNPHWHGLFVDGVFGKQTDGSPVFHPLPRLATEEVGDLLQVVRVRILSYLARRGVIEAGPELTVLDDGFAEREPALAQLAAASVAHRSIYRPWCELLKGAFAEDVD